MIFLDILITLHRFFRQIYTNSSRSSFYKFLELLNGESLILELEWEGDLLILSSFFFGIWWINKKKAKRHIQEYKGHTPGLQRIKIERDFPKTKHWIPYGSLNVTRCLCANSGVTIPGTWTHEHARVSAF